MGRKLTYQKCYDIALQFTTVKELKTIDPSAYHTMLRNHWMEDYTWLVYGEKGSKKNKSRKPRGYWTFDKCFEKSLNCFSITDFMHRENTAYQTALKNNWISLLFPNN